MLTIRDEQMRSMEAAALQVFLQAAAEDVKRRLPGCCAHLSGVELSALLQAGVVSAEGYGINDRAELAKFLDLVVAHGAAFAELDLFGWAEPILTDAGISEDVKMATLLERLPQTLSPEPVCADGAAREGES